MTSQWNRRDVLRGLSAMSAAACVPLSKAAATDQVNPQIEILVTSVSEHTLRLSLVPTVSAASKAIPDIGVGKFRLKILWSPINISIADAHDKLIQQFEWDANTGALSFLTGTAPLP